MLIAFDLDDTLYKERDYVASGHRAVAEAVAADLNLDVTSVMNNGRDPFDALHDYLVRHNIHSWPIERMVTTYRNHRPQLQPDPRIAREFDRLRSEGHNVVIITDGSTARQMAKIQALGLDRAVDAIYISEAVGGDKTTGAGFRAASIDFPQPHRIYIGDNPAKDFYLPNLNGWNTIMLIDSDGVNIFPQSAPDAAHKARTAIFDLISYLKTL